MNKIPLRLALIVPFMLLTVGTSSLVGYLSWRSGQQAVNQLAAELRNKTTNRVQQYLDTYLATPILVNRLNADAVRLGELDLNDLTKVERHLLITAQQFNMVSLISFGNEQGDLRYVCNAYQCSQFEYTLGLSDPADPTQISGYQVDNNGNRGERLLSFQQPKVQECPWYRAAVEAGRPVRVPIFVLGDRSGLSLNASHPVYAPGSGRLIGVFSAASHLSYFNQFMASLRVGRTGRAFVLERNGLLVSTSTEQLPYLVRQQNRAQQIDRIPAIASTDPFIRAASEHLYSRFPDLDIIQAPQQLEFFIDRDRQFAQVVPYQDAYGLDWLIVVTVPESDFMEQINAQMRITLLLSLAALAGSIAFGLWLAHFLICLKTALQESEAKFTRVFRTCPDPIALVSSEGRYLAINDACVKVFGYSREEIIGRTAAEVGAWVNLDDRQHYVQVVQAGESIRDWEFTLRTKAGQLLTVLFSAESLELQGQFCIVAIAKDITDRKQAELALAQEILRRNALLNASVDGIVVTDQAGNVLEANASFAKMLGYTLEEITTLNLRDIDVGWSSKVIDQRIVEQDLCIHTFQTRYRRKDGSIYDVEISANSLEQDGQRIQLCICRDITDRKQAEAALLQSEAQYRLLFENNPNPMWIFELETLAFLAVNQAVIAHYGYSQAEFLSMTIADICPPEDIPALRASLTKSIPSFWVVSAKHLKRNGEVIDVELSCHAITWQGKPARFVLAKDITDRKRAEQALRESEERFQLVAETIDQCFFVRPVDFGPYFYISPAYEKIWGCSRASLEQDPDSWLNSVHPDDREAVSISMVEQAQGHSVQQEYRIIRPDGETRWISTQIFPVHDKFGHLAQYVGLAEDITDRKQVEELLRSQAEQERLVSAITQDIRQSLDLEQILATTTIEVQRTLQADRVLILRLYQDGSGQVIQESVVPPYASLNQVCWLSDCFPSSNRNYYRQGTPRIVVDAANDEQETCLSEFMQEIGVRSKVVAPIIQDIEADVTQVWGLLIVHTCDADRQWQQSEAEFLQQISNQLAIAIYQANLYQQLQAELVERRQTEKALRDSETRFRTIFAEAPVGMMLLSEQGQIVQVNRAFCRLLDYTESDLQTDNIWHLTYPEDVQLEQGLFHQLFNQEIPGYTLEKRLFKRNREIVWVSLTAGLLQDPNNGEFYKLGMYENITEQRIVQRMKDNFVSVISHELRTPLTSVRGALKLLAIEELPNLTTEGQELLNIALLDSQRLVRLVSDILDLERLRSGHLPIVKKRWNVADLITQSINTVQPLAEEAEIQLEIAVEPVIVSVDGDRINQTLTNLLSNAIKFSAPKATVTIRVTLMPESASSPHPHRPYVLVVIQDQGRGIPLEKLDVIFEPFEQVDVTGSGHKGGSGLGLAICQNIVQRHGGQIWATSTMGQGSSFFFTLPIDNTAI